jgi:hypothetical protein
MKTSVSPTELEWADAISAMPVRIITLKETEFTRCEAMVARAGFRGATRSVGILGKDKRAEYSQNRDLLTLRALYEIEYGRMREAHSSMPSWGGVGCYLSHLELWKEASESDYGLFVFEADAVPFPGVFEQVKRALVGLHAKNLEIDQYVFGHFGAVESRATKVAGVRLATGRLYGLTGYYISPHGARKLLKTAFPIEVQVDSYTGYTIPELDSNVPGNSISLYGDSNNATIIVGVMGGLLVLAIFAIMFLVIKKQTPNKPEKRK